MKGSKKYKKDKKDKKEIALNTQLWLHLLLFVLFVFFSVLFAKDGDIGGAVGFAVAALLPLFVFAISPMYYVFSEDRLEIIYLWNQKEVIKWSMVNSITFDGSWISKYSSPPHYHIAYCSKNKTVFFLDGDVSKTGRTKKLIAKYYKKSII